MSETIVVKQTEKEPVVVTEKATAVTQQGMTNAVNVTEKSTASITEKETSVVIISQGAKGDKGDPGSGGTTLTGVAGEPISAGHAIYISSADGRAYLWSPSNTALAGKLAGITTTAASGAGEDVQFITSGEITGLSGFVIESRLFVQPGSGVGSTVPISGVLQQVGVAKSTTIAIIHLSDPFIL